MEKSLHLRKAKGRMWPLAPPPFPAPCPALAAEHGCGRPLELSFCSGASSFSEFSFKKKTSIELFGLIRVMCKWRHPYFGTSYFISIPRQGFAEVNSCLMFSKKHFLFSEWPVVWAVDVASLTLSCGSHLCFYLNAVLILSQQCKHHLLVDCCVCFLNFLSTLNHWFCFPPHLSKQSYTLKKKNIVLIC